MRFMVGIALVLASAALPSGAAEDAPGYIARGDRPDLTRILPAPPAPGSAEAEADRRIYRESRRLQGSARWDQATLDVNGSMYDHFACALGFRC